MQTSEDTINFDIANIDLIESAIAAIKESIPSNYDALAIEHGFDKIYKECFSNNICMDSITVEKLKNKAKYVENQYYASFDQVRQKLDLMKQQCNKLEPLQTQMKTYHAALKKSIDSYQKLVIKQIEIPFFLYCSRLLQSYQGGQGVLIDSKDSKIRFTAPGGEHDILYTMSSGQLSAVLLAFSLVLNKIYSGNNFKTLFIDDPIQCMDDINMISFVELLQEKLAKNKKAPARHKAEDDYLLTTKLFCGDCQSLMFGESGTSQSGATYHYYKCSSAKKKTGCNRKPVKKKWIEDAVLDQVKTVLHDDVFIGDVVHKYLEYQQQENTVIPYLEKNLADTQRSIDNLIAAIEQGIITSSTKQRLETLEVTKRELEDKILIENMKRPLRTEDELWAWFRYMRNFDLTRLEERRQLIDVFVNTVFLYSDRFLLTLNFGYGSKTVLFTDIPCSDKVACGRPYNKKQG